MRTWNYINVLAKYPRQIGWAFHGGDSWRLTPKLNLSYSLRWDYITPFMDKKQPIVHRPHRGAIRMRSPLGS